MCFGEREPVLGQIGPRERIPFSRQREVENRKKERYLAQCLLDGGNHVEDVGGETDKGEDSQERDTVGLIKERERGEMMRKKKERKKKKKKKRKKRKK